MLLKLTTIVQIAGELVKNINRLDLLTEPRLHYALKSKKRRPYSLPGHLHDFDLRYPCKSEAETPMPNTKTLFLNRQAGSHLFCSEIEDWQIHVSAQAGPSERHAAEEFQYWFEMTSGNRLTLTNTKTGDGQIQIESAEGSTGVNQSESFQQFRPCIFKSQRT